LFQSIEPVKNATEVTAVKHKLVAKDNFADRTALHIRNGLPEITAQPVAHLKPRLRLEERKKQEIERKQLMQHFKFLGGR